MTSPQGSEPVGNPEWSPYGDDAWEIADYARDLALTLPAPRGDVPITADGEPTWTEEDRYCFAVYSEFQVVRCALSPVEGVGEVVKTIDRLQAALPFSEGERLWLMDMQKTPYSGELAQALVSREAIVTSNGLRQVVRGRELVRRWAAFRRSTDEFSTLGTIDEAIGHARELARLIQPRMPDETTPHIPTS